MKALETRALNPFHVPILLLIAAVRRTEVLLHSLSSLWPFIIKLQIEATRFKPTYDLGTRTHANASPIRSSVDTSAAGGLHKNPCYDHASPAL
jgi:hypothetical protein